MNRQKLKWFWELLKKSYAELQQNDPLRLSSSTAFFAIFSIIPIIVLILNLLGTIMSEQFLTKELFNTLQRMIGGQAVNYLSNTLENVQQMQQGAIITVGIIIFLMFVATTLFHVIQNSLNQIWQVKPRANANLKYTLKNRGLSLVIIFFGGVLFLASFLTDVAVQFIGDNFTLIYGIDLVIVWIANITFSLAIITVGLASVYKYLPDIYLSGKPVWIGSSITSILFLIGQYILGKVIISGNLNNIYGASASVVLLLLFIFYLSFIFYYGFCLVKVYAQEKKYVVKSTQYAVQYEINELE